MTPTKERPNKAETLRATLPKEPQRTKKDRPTVVRWAKKPHTLDNDGGPAKPLHLFENTLDF